MLPKLVIEEHPYHAQPILVAELISAAGNEVNEVQNIQAPTAKLLLLVFTPNKLQLDISVGLNVVIEEQPRHVCCKLVAPLKSIAGKDVSEEQEYHASWKLVPLDVSINGKLVRLLQLYQEALKLVPLDVSINGKLVRLEHPFQAAPKLVTEEVLISGKLVRLLQLAQV